MKLIPLLLVSAAAAALENYHTVHTDRSLAKSSTVTKTFKFKDDFFLRFSTLSTGISPEYGEELLDKLNNEYGEEFRDKWVTALMGDLPDECSVEEMSIPIFSICKWRYPDYYNVEELPVAGQSYVAEDIYIQRLYYQVESLKISCLNPQNDYPTYQDLDKDYYTAQAFEGDSFRNILNDSSCQQDTACYWSTVDSIDYDTFSEDYAGVYVQRFMNVEMYLKCLNRAGYGPDIANVLIEAMDSYFELNVESVLTEEILGNVPLGAVYNYASPYEDKVGRVFFTHGPYYTGGDMIDQVQVEDGDLVTKFEYGFDVVWFWPKDSTNEIIVDVPTTVNPVYQNGSFLTYLQENYSQYGWVQRLDFCEPVNTMPDFPQVSFTPTPAPTEKPTKLSELGGSCNSDDQCEDGLECHLGSSTCVCNMDTGYGCFGGTVCQIYEKDQIPRCYCDMFNDEGPNGCEYGQFCRFSCKFTSDNPRCFDDEFIRDCGSYGDRYTCADSNNDGLIDVNDKSGGCDFKAPTKSPVTLPPLETGEPTVFQSPAPTISIPAVTPAPTMSLPTEMPTSFPTLVEEIITCDSNSTNTCPDGYCCVNDECVKCICHPTEKPKPIVGTCGNGDRGDGICAWEGYCCSEWGWCGTTSEYCEGPSNAPTPSGFYPPPTPSLDAGKCGSGDAGEGLCADPTHCCSQWGYCGPGEGYCYVVDDGTNADGTCGGGGVGNGVCGSGHCCSQYGYCGEGPEYCTGFVDKGEITTDEELIIERAPLPNDLLPVFGFRCGITEVDARSNCKKECTHHIQCGFGEECWGIQLNYCNTFEEGSHPVCTDLDMANTDSRCGYDEVNAREHCGPKCSADSDCGEQQFCYPTILNLCDCFEDMGNGCVDPVFSEAEDSIKPYFLGELVAAKKPVAVEGDGEVEGVPRNGSFKLATVCSVFVSLLAAFAMY